MNTINQIKTSYKSQLDAKVERVNKQFAEYLTAGWKVEVFDSPAQHFRQRVEFRLWHERDAAGNDTGSAFYAMFEPGKRAGRATLKRIEQLEIAGADINALMPRLLQALQASPILLQRLYQVEFLATLSGDMLVTLIYHKLLDDEWQAWARKLEENLSIHIIGRSRKQKVVISRDFVNETMRIDGRKFHYRQVEGGFTQPNARVCEKMLAWACATAELISCQSSTDSGQDLLELYCGNGNFTLPLSHHFRRVLASEVAKSSVAVARHNITENSCNNIAIARLSAKEVSQAIIAKRQFKRLKHDGINVDDYNFSTVFVDPPRAGIDEDTLGMMQQFEHILYVSCNPDSLFDNLRILSRTHKLERMAIFDQFPYTHHIEMAVWLQKI